MNVIVNLHICILQVLSFRETVCSNEYVDTVIQQAFEVWPSFRYKSLPKVKWHSPSALLVIIIFCTPEFCFFVQIAPIQFLIELAIRSKTLEHLVEVACIVPTGSVYLLSGNRCHARETTLAQFFEDESGCIGIGSEDYHFLVGGLVLLLQNGNQLIQFQVLLKTVLIILSKSIETFADGSQFIDVHTKSALKASEIFHVRQVNGSLTQRENVIGIAVLVIVGNIHLYLSSCFLFFESNYLGKCLFVNFQYLP